MAEVQRRIAVATIAASASVSGEVDIGGATIVGIHMPADWDAANLTFQAAHETGGTYWDVYDDAGTEVSVTAAADRAIGCDAKALELSAWRYIKIRSGTTGTPVTQTAARTLVLVLK